MATLVEWFEEYGPVSERLAWLTVVVTCIPRVGLAAWLTITRQVTYKRTMRMIWPEILLVAGFVTPSIFGFLQRTPVYFHRIRRRIRQTKPWSFQVGGSLASLPAMSESGKFPLDPLDREIRLLRFLSCEKDDQIQIESLKFSLSEEPVYHAISYRWGDISRRSTILMDGAEVDISSDLYDALLALRHYKPSEGVPLFWIDALSIDQRDEGERSSQVRQMKDIYRMASKVIVWLGTPSEDSELAMAKVKAMEAFFYMLITTPKKMMEDNTPPVDYGSKESPYLSLLPSKFDSGDRHFEPWRAIYRVLDNSWWIRAWIAQEVTSETIHLSPPGNVEIILGRNLQTISLRSTMQLIAFLANLMESFERENQEDSDFLKQLKICSFRISRLIAIGRLRKKTSITQRIYSILTSDTGTTKEQKLWSQKVWPVLNLFRGLEASDARDRVYAALPLALPDGHPAFEPDYSLCIEQVYAQVAQNFIKYQKSLDIITACNPEASDLPTFVPDWRTLVSTNPLCRLVGADQHPIYQACAQTLPRVTIQEEPVSIKGDLARKRSTRFIMSARGISIDVITQVSTDQPGPTQFRRPKWESILHGQDPHYAPTNETLVCAYQRLLVADIRESEEIELDGSRGTFLQRAAVWLELLIEAGVEDWLTQVERLPRSYSFLQKLYNERLRRWQAHHRGARVEPSLNLAIPWFNSTREEREDSFNHLNSSSSALNPTSPSSADHTIAVGHRVEDHGNTKGEGIKNENERHTSELEIPDVVPESILRWTDSSSRDFATENFRKLLSFVNVGRTLCITQRGYIALVPRHTRPTDLIVILFGGRTPFVIRQLQADDTYETSRWQVVGEAYVHGIMDGEIFNNLSESELEAQSEIFHVV